MRRQYLDVAISQLRPLYMRSLQRYNRILQQRNKLIKAAAEPEGRRNFDETVEFWSSELAHEAAFITVSRVKYLELASAVVGECFDEMTGGREVPEIEYMPSVRMSADEMRDAARCEEIYAGRLAENHDREIAVGATLWGTHKDDMEIRINDRPARQFASQGQQRSLSLALKLAEGAISRRDSGEEPVFLLDDVFSELDAGRRAYLTEKMREKQIILSTCTEHEGDMGSAYTGAEVIKVKGGCFSRQ